MQVTLVGCGNMGSALLLGIARTGLVSSFHLFNRSSAKAESLARQLPNASVFSNAADALAGANVVLLAVEPDGILPLLSELAGVLETSRPLVISVAAGVRLSQMQALVPHARLVRLMPNTAVAIGEGSSGFVCSSSCLAADAPLCQRLFAATGLCVELSCEDDIQAVVSLAGSAPAFFYELLDAMQQQGVAQGLSPELSLQLATQAMKGSAALQQQSGQDPKSLRNAITSPNGATLAGLRRLNALQLKQHWQSVLQACANRLQEMDAERS
ncbi:MAG: pyrroline-5-carboxylate reductase [Akkermansia sp.]